MRDVSVGPTAQHYLHTIEGGADAPAAAPALVMMPGYAAGSGFYFRNFAGLAKHFRYFAVDWLGTGMSGRARFKASGHQETEDWFVDSLNEWRKQEVGRRST